jgi:uncharacterized protein YkwD
MVIALLMIMQMSGGPRPAFALTNCTVSDLTYDSEEQEFLRLINNYRAQNGRAALTASTNLHRAASWMAADMANKNYFSHTDSLGRSAGTRVANCDGKPSVGENIAAGTVKSRAQDAFEMWRTSSGHNANMLNANYKQIGIARHYNASSRYGWYWVTDFSTTDDGTRLGTSGGGGGGGGTASPTPTPAPPTPTPAPSISKAAMTSPTPGSTFTSTTVTFNWSAGGGAQEYFLYLGTSQGSNNLYGASQGVNLSRTLSGLPRDGRTIHVRLWTRFSTGWQYTDYTYKAVTLSVYSGR